MSAIRDAYGDQTLEVVLTGSLEEFDSYPVDQRFDLRTVSRLGTS